MHSRQIAIKHGALASTGIIQVAPGSTNTVPGWAQFSLDIRAAHDDTLLKMEEILKSNFGQLVQGASLDGSEGGRIQERPCTVEWRLDSTSSATKFDTGCIECVRQSAGDVLGQQSSLLVQNMTSGAGNIFLSFKGLRRMLKCSTGHDSVHTRKRCPTSMIFVPCLNGVSHNPREYCAPEDCANGAQVLLKTIIRYDQLRQQTAERR